LITEVHAIKPASPLADAPHAKGYPLLGNTLSMLSNPALYLAKQYQLLGSVFHIQAGFKKYVVLAGEDANKFLAKEDSVLLESHTLFGGFADAVNTDVMLTAIDGEPHKHMRRLMRPGFSRSAAVPHIQTMVNVVNDYAHTWQPNQEIAVLETMRRIVVDQLGLITNSMKPTDYFNDILYFINTMLNTEVLRMYPKFVRSLPRFRQARQRLLQLKKEVLEWHHQNPPTNRPRDLIDDMLDGLRPDGEPFSDDDWFNLAVGPYFAGMDTLASTMAFFMYSMAKNPAVMAQCKQEADALFATGKLAIEDFRKIETLHAAALETLRLYPATPFTPRVVAKDFEFGGYHFTTGTEVMFAQTATHFLPEYYDNPEVFDIRHFSGDKNGRIANVFTPFTVGSHSCLGAGLAEVQMLVIMATLLHVADFELINPDDEIQVHTLPLPNPGKNFRLRIKAVTL
jgi:cytochrome P450